MKTTTNKVLSLLLTFLLAISAFAGVTIAIDRTNPVAFAASSFPAPAATPGETYDITVNGNTVSATFDYADGWVGAAFPSMYMITFTVSGYNDGGTVNLSNIPGDYYVYFLDNNGGLVFAAWSGTDTFGLQIGNGENKYYLSTMELDMDVDEPDDNDEPEDYRPPYTPQRPNRPSGGGGGSGGGSSPAPSTTASRPLSNGNAVSAIKSQLNAHFAGDEVVAAFQNIGEVSQSVFEAMVKAADGKTVDARFDSMNGGAVDVRLYIDPSKVTGGLNVSASTVNQTAQSTKRSFEKFFENNVAVSVSSSKALSARKSK